MAAASPGQRRRGFLTGQTTTPAPLLRRVLALESTGAGGLGEKPGAPLPQYGLAGKTVLPLATGGTTAHVLATDYALRPVLSSMGAGHIVQGWFTLDKDIAVGEDGTLTVAPGPAEALEQVVDQFSEALGSRTALLAAAG